MRCTIETLLEWLGCPHCGGALRLPGNDRLVCRLCGHAFPIQDGIPILLPQTVQTPERYWDPAPMAALYDQKVEGENTPFGRYNHASELHAITALYRPDQLALVLDAGCGNGRFLETLPPESLRIGVDASLNLLRIARDRGRGDFHLCCDLEHLPFRDRLFTTVISCRVLQHLTNPDAAVAEMARVTRPGGDLILEVYNACNLKTLYKWLRQSPLHRWCNAPFRWLFRSMSPFAPWGLDYDRYDSWWRVRRWMVRHGLHAHQGRGAGFGYHKYLLIPFYLDAWAQRRLPRLLAAYYRRCLQLEQQLGHLPPWRWFLEKLAIRGTKPLPSESPVPPPRRDRILAALNQAWHRSWLCTFRGRLETIREAIAPTPPTDPRHHLQAAIDWVKRAQDATPDRGVSRGYAAGWVQAFKGGGWQPSYPETTGYLIPTCLNAARLLKDRELRERAIAMAEWEIQVQLPSGAVQGGTITHDRLPTPSVFNTGQVILGWLAAFQETADPRYLAAARQAGTFLLEVQDPDGSFRLGNSRFADPSATTYNARCGWALILLGQATGQVAFVDGGEKNIGFTLTRQHSNGWWAQNCLSLPVTPLLHTLCYVVEGLLGAAVALDRQDWIDRARLTVDAVLARVATNGRLPGRFDADWRPTVAWECLTGSAQLAGLAQQLFALTGQRFYREKADLLLLRLMTTQNLTSTNGGLRGGIKGSHPFDGDYGRYEVLNWPTKFFIDALLVQLAGADMMPLRGKLPAPPSRSDEAC